LPENMESPMHPIYHYAVITDSVEGLILVNIDTLMDRDPTNNFLERALTWNENGVLSGARHVTLAGSTAYIVTGDKLVVISLDNPLEPKFLSSLPFREAWASAIQFRYLFVSDAHGFHAVDVTNPAKPRRVKG